MSDNPFESGGSPFSPEVNPYQAPQITPSPSDFGDAAGPDPNLARAADMLAQTKPWVRFMSVMVFIAAAIYGMLGLLIVIGGIAADMHLPFGGIVGIVYIVMAIFYIVPGIFLWNFADRIGAFLFHRTPGALASALESQKSFWKFVGIFTLVALCLFVLFLMLVFVTALG